MAPGSLSEVSAKPRGRLAGHRDQICWKATNLRPQLVAEDVIP